MENYIGKKFSITCNNDFQSFAYDIEKLENGKVVFDRLESIDENLENSEYKRNFYLKKTLPEGNDLLIVTLKNNKVSINRYTLENKTLRVQKNIANISYDVVSSETASEIEVGLYENTKKPICVFDVASKKEIVPSYSYNCEEKNVKGKFKLNANQKYIVLKYEK